MAIDVSALTKQAQANTGDALDQAFNAELSSIDAQVKQLTDNYKQLRLEQMKGGQLGYQNNANLLDPRGIGMGDASIYNTGEAQNQYDIGVQGDLGVAGYGAIRGGIEANQPLKKSASQSSLSGLGAQLSRDLYYYQEKKRLQELIAKQRGAGTAAAVNSLFPSRAQLISQNTANKDPKVTAMKNAYNSASDYSKFRMVDNPAYTRYLTKSEPQMFNSLQDIEKSGQYDDSEFILK